MTVLVAAASRHGATDAIAERIGAGLAGRGVEVEVKRLRDVGDLERYEACVVGSAVYFGTWLKEARRFVDLHADELSRRPTWLFASGPVVGDPPPVDDPNALRPNLATQLLEATHAREHRLFGGKLDRAALGPAERATVRLVHAREGDYRDWQAVDEWAAAIADAIRAEPSPA